MNCTTFHLANARNLILNSWYASHRWSVYLWINTIFTCLIALKIRCIQIKPNILVKWSSKVQFISCFCSMRNTTIYGKKEWKIELIFITVPQHRYFILLIVAEQFFFFFSACNLNASREQITFFFIHSLTSFAASVWDAHCTVSLIFHLFARMLLLCLQFDWGGEMLESDLFISCLIFFFEEKKQWILYGEYYCKNAVIN